MLLAVAAIWVLGLAEFSKALDPTGAERDGVELTLVNARLDGSGDWLTAGSVQGIQVTRAGIVVDHPPGGTVLYSRRVSVLPHDCYSLAFRGSSVRRSLAVRVVADDATTPLSSTVRLGSAGSTTKLAFAPRGRHAVIVVVSTAGSGAQGFLVDARLTRLGDAAC
jgi:hypothetical protein